MPLKNDWFQSKWDIILPTKRQDLEWKKETWPNNKRIRRRRRKNNWEKDMCVCSMSRPPLFRLFFFFVWNEKTRPACDNLLLLGQKNNTNCWALKKKKTQRVMAPLPNGSTHCSSGFASSFSSSSRTRRRRETVFFLFVTLYLIKEEGQERRHRVVFPYSLLGVCSIWWRLGLRFSSLNQMLVVVVVTQHKRGERKKGGDDSTIIDSLMKLQLCSAEKGAFDLLVAVVIVVGGCWSRKKKQINRL